MGLWDAGVSLLAPPLDPLDETWSCVVVGVQRSQHGGIPVAWPGWESGPFPQNRMPDLLGLAGSRVVPAATSPHARQLSMLLFPRATDESGSPQGPLAGGCWHLTWLASAS